MDTGSCASVSWIASRQDPNLYKQASSRPLVAAGSSPPFPERIGAGFNIEYIYG
jgi:hypothetical protein